MASLAGKDKSRSKENSKRRGNRSGKSEVEVQGNINTGRDKCNLKSKRRKGEERAVRMQKRREIPEQDLTSFLWNAQKDRGPFVIKQILPYKDGVSKRFWLKRTANESVSNNPNGWRTCLLLLQFGCFTQLLHTKEDTGGA